MAVSDNKFSKLPTFAKPTLYQITLKPCLETFKFTGNELIQLEILKPTSFLKLHASGLDILDASLKLPNGNVLNKLKCDLDERWTLLTVLLPEEVGPQKVELEINFSGKIRTDELKGFYRSPYKDSSGNPQFMASTKFESTYARRAFPCWDEPIYKAQFDIRLEVASELMALSNMDVASEANAGNGRKLVTFGRTPPMSTYLVAFAIGQFEFVEDHTKDGCRVRIYTVPGKRESGRYALGVAVKSIDFYSDWFNLKMPLPKADLIGVPEFEIGAMENWGLVTFREFYLLFDPAQSSSRVRQSVTMVLSHEIAHFWFGNLVTMKWWGDLWLKEGFANFMEFVFTAAFYPEFNVWSEFVNSQVATSMQLDALRSSHPIEVPIENPNEMDEIFDQISYDKSNSIIRMLYNYLGESVFQQGLRTYLTKYSYSNAETEQFWQCLSDASGIVGFTSADTINYYLKDVGALMGSWTKQMGFPLVTVEERQLDGNRRELRVRQRRFLADGGKDEAASLWQVPIPVTVSSDPSKPKAKFLLDKAEDKFILEGVGPNEWVKLNSDFASFFRVHYSDSMFRLLLDGIRKRELNALDRYQISSDIFAIIESGQMPITPFLEFLSACSEEDELVVWQSVGSNLAHINLILDYAGDARLKEQFHKFVCTIVEPVAARFGWEPKEGESHQNGQLRALLLSLLARCRHQPTIQMALSKFKEHVEKGVELVPDLRNTIFGTIARTNQREAIGQLQNILATCNFAEIERSCLLALGQCTDVELLKDLFGHYILGKNIKCQDVCILFMSVNMSGCARTQEYAWHFFTQHQPQFRALFGSPAATLFQTCFKAAAESFCSSEAMEKIQMFCDNSFDYHDLNTLKRPIQQVLETIKLNERLLKNSIGPMKEYLGEAGFAC